MTYDVSAGPRRLAAIMFTDLVGFTRLAQHDEELALRLRAEHQALVHPIIAAHGGREVKSMGDGLLVEFPSAVESVRCAVALQGALAHRNAETTGDPPLEMRVGIHLGDVIGEGDDILGDAVNIASRIEPLAEPGGICVTGPVVDQVRNKVPLPLEKLGPQPLRHVDQPVDVYRVVLSVGTAARRATDPEVAENVRLVVLPFASMSPDERDGYLADGLTDELITQTAKIPSVRVIPRTSVLRYKGSTKSLREVAQDLGVRLALEGSVRKSGDRLRITVTLVDPRSEDQLWSSRYDRPLGDIFAIQDDIAGQVAASVSRHVAQRVGAPKIEFRRGAPDTRDMEAYALFLHGRKLMTERRSEESIRQSRAYFEQAVARDPHFARAHVGIGEAALYLGGEGAEAWSEAIATAQRETTRALELDDQIAEAHSVMSSILLTTEDFAGSEREARRAMTLNPSLSEPYRWLAQIAAGRGELDEAVRLLETALEIDPLDVNVIVFLGRLYFYSGREREAVAHWDRFEPLVPFRINAHRTEYYVVHDQLDRAERTLHEMERLRPSSIWNVMWGGILAAKRGDAAQAQRAIRALEERPDVREVTVWAAGFVRYALGDIDGFLDAMEWSRREGTEPVVELMHSPLFKDVRRHPRMIKFLQERAASQVTSSGRSH
ncbi:MAG TPA: adenylate/guanylate cyclase domain-containing protein [Thermoplasmata archaeon]|nr:adenylate/guanylate cyclase domain-containing protein [Thermoplasmata archaeon]